MGQGEYGEYLSGLHNAIYCYAGRKSRRTFKRKQIDEHRLAYVSEAPVNWCPELGTVLANEEVIDGKSEVGGFPVVRKSMRQWMLRITAYAEKLLADLDTIDWANSLKEMQRNWIDRSEGATVKFQIDVPGPNHLSMDVFTTRPDTLFGATHMVVAPEHWLIDHIWTIANQEYRVNDQITSPTIRTFGEVDSPINLSLTEALARAKARGLDLIEVNPKMNPPACMFENYAKHAAYQEAISKQKQAVISYREQVARKSDLERTELAKEKTGVFTGAFAINPVNGKKIPIWIADYVLANYGTGAIMAVPAHDTRDFEFATKFKLEIVTVVKPKNKEGLSWERFGETTTVKKESSSTTESKTVLDLWDRKKGKIAFEWDERKTFTYDGEASQCVNSANRDITLNDLSTLEAKKKITDWLEAKSLGKKTINYKLRDWLFSRQRYWGEPFPIVWKKDAAGSLYHEALPESALPLLPPSLEDYKPTTDGQPPLARAKDWLNLPDGSVRETNTMPQWAGSCWYYLRYLDAKNSNVFVGKDAENYWMGAGRDGVSPSQTSDQSGTATRHPSQGVDLYVGGTEHAVLHLLYARFWHKVLFDLGYVSTPEPFFKLVNQGLILGEDGQKMSKSRGNVVNPDDVMAEYGADAFRLYEMFMGPLQDTKPWNTRGVEGVYRFLGRVWRLFVDENSETEFEQAETTSGTSSRRCESADSRVFTNAATDLLDLIKLNPAIKDVAATAAQLKTLHACIKKVTEDLDGMRFNTAISAMMVFVNDAITWETKPVSVMRVFLILLQPFAPHLAEELWNKLNFQHPTSNIQHPITLAYAPWPKFNAALLVENEIEIPVQVNGKLRDVIEVSVNATAAELEVLALANEKARPYYAGKTIKKIIVVPKKLVNIVAG